MRTFSVKNFEKFQHYKDRNPPWIKLYNELLDDYEFGLLPDASKMHLIAIWLLASRSENKIPFDSEWVSRRINATDKVNLQSLLELGFILLDQRLPTVVQDASKPLAECLSRDREETEGETEIRPVEKKKEVSGYSEEFEVKFWKLYPTTNTMSKKEAWKAWQRLTPVKRDAACKAIEPYRQSMRSKPEYIKHACRFLSQEIFEGFVANGTTIAPVFDIRAHLA